MIGDNFLSTTYEFDHIKITIGVVEIAEFCSLHHGTSLVRQALEIRKH